jgi:septal ring factor EnvC (AmiA/AmiB activator)
MLPRQLPEADPAGRFAWPLRGTVLVDFGAKNGKEVSQGINIAAPIGAPVRATADGEVVYRGSELDGYGQLLLVKHNDGWVSAYAHNDAILVRKGDFVRQGQVIAKVGRSGSVDRPQLHFQLRKDLQPQDPIIAMQGDSRGQGLTAASLR